MFDELGMNLYFWFKHFVYKPDIGNRFWKKKTREKIVPYGYKCMWCAISMIEWFTTSQYQVLVYLVNIEIYAQDLAKFA